MNLAIVLIVAIVLSIAFHFVGIYANAKKTVWVMLVLMWAAAINIAMSEIKPKGYEDIKSMKGKYKDVDLLIEKAMPEVSIYEMLKIKKSFQIHEPKQ
ncbi:hypothetical protein SAMN06313486_10631 [Epsilonproteobacteria bacterium SCGC AD-308-P11]|jgi:hypothetical protein|nr:hypothetical protein SAMN06313486_10631 [Epsilonproteobacteria bacterium SCGC AD-308-P11]